MTPNFTGHEVIDEHGETIGTISDVFFDDSSNEPRWMVVNPGVFRKERLVPVTGAYQTDDGKVMVPFDRQMIKNAPTVGGSHYPDRSALQLAAQHFDLEP